MLVGLCEKNTASPLSTSTSTSTSRGRETINPVLAAAAAAAGEGEDGSKTDKLVEGNTSDLGGRAGRPNDEQPEAKSDGSIGSESSTDSSSDDCGAEDQDEDQDGRGSIIIGGHEWSTEKAGRRSSIGGLLPALPTAGAVVAVTEKSRRSSFSSVL